MNSKGYLVCKFALTVCSTHPLMYDWLTCPIKRVPGQDPLPSGNGNKEEDDEDDEEEEDAQEDENE